MTYVSEQTSEELRQHMRSLRAMKGWHEPLADRLWKEVQTLDRQNAELIARIRELEGDTGKSAEAWPDIATAPKDGTEVLLLGTRHSMLYPKPERMVAKYDRGWWSAGDVVSHATNWHPLPDLPSAGRAAPEGTKAERLAQLQSEIAAHLAEDEGGKP